VLVQTVCGQIPKSPGKAGREMMQLPDPVVVVVVVVVVARAQATAALTN